MRYKFQLIVGAFIFVYLLVSALVLNFYNDLAMKDAKKEAYYVLEGINSVREYIAGVQRPLIEQLKEQGILKEDFFDERLLSSSYISREIYNIQKKKYNLEFDYKLVAIAPLNKAHEPNEFEAGVLHGFKENKFKEFVKIIKDENGSQLFVGLPIKNQSPSCLACHSSANAPQQMLEKYGMEGIEIPDVNETVAMISFKIPIRAIFTYHLQEVIVIMSAITLIFGLFLLLVYKMHRRGEESKKQTEQLMIHQSRLASMGEMIGNISHQWKQPLAQISSALINLELYQERKKFKVLEVINQTIKILNATLKKYQIEVQLDVRENFEVFANFNEIIQILINIINNAKDAFKQSYTKPRVIKISAFLKDDRKNLCVQNKIFAKNVDENHVAFTISFENL